jgi:hypothetical protein
VPADDIGGIRKAVGVGVARRAQQQRGGIDRPTADNNDVRVVDLLAAAAVDHDPLDRALRGVDLQTRDPRVGPQRDVGVLEGGANADDVRVGLSVRQAREAVEPVAADTTARLGTGFV